LEEIDLQTKGSAEKRHRQSLKHRAANRSAKTRIRTAERKLEEALEAKDKAAAEALLKTCAQELDSAATSGVIHRNMAARKKSRLAAMVAAGKSTT
jgi:small subunit ribosomal protein S20